MVGQFVGPNKICRARLEVELASTSQPGPHKPATRTGWPAVNIKKIYFNVLKFKKYIVYVIV